MIPTITAFERSPDRGRGQARYMRVRWALEEVGQPYDVRLVSFRELKEPAHRALQPFGQIPTYEEGDLTLFESGAIILHILIDGQVAAPKHPKAALQEWALARKRKPPEYRLVRREGPDHAPRFRVAVAVGKLAEAEGEGASKQAAEKAAATALLERLTEEDAK